MLEEQIFGVPPPADGTSRRPQGARGGGSQKGALQREELMAQEEMRVDATTGAAYTKAQFVERFGGAKEWNSSIVRPPSVTREAAYGCSARPGVSARMPDTPSGCGRFNPKSRPRVRDIVPPAGPPPTEPASAGRDAYSSARGSARMVYPREQTRSTSPRAAERYDGPRVERYDGEKPWSPRDARYQPVQNNAYQSREFHHETAAEVGLRTLPTHLIDSVPDLSAISPGRQGSGRQGSTGRGTPGRDSPALIGRGESNAKLVGDTSPKGEDDAPLASPRGSSPPPRMRGSGAGSTSVAQRGPPEMPVRRSLYREPIPVRPPSPRIARAMEAVGPRGTPDRLAPNPQGEVVNAAPVRGWALNTGVEYLKQRKEERMRRSPR